MDYAQSLTMDFDDDWCPTRPKRWPGPGPGPWPPVGVLDVEVAAAKRDLALLGLALATTPALRERAAGDAAGLSKDLELQVSKEAAGKAGRFAATMV